MRTLTQLAFIVLVMSLAACQSAPPETPPAIPTLIASHTPANTPSPAPNLTATPAPTVTPSPPRVKFRVANASPMIAEFDTYLSEQLVGFGTRYGSASGQAEVNAGDYTLRLLPPNSRPDAIPYAEFPIRLAPNAAHLALIVPDGESYTLQQLIEDETPVPSGNARLAVLNRLADAPQWSARTQTLTWELAVNAPPIYQMLPSGEHTLVFADSSTLPLQLAANRAYTLILSGSTANIQPILIDAPLQSSTPLSFVHLSSAAGSVDLYLNGERYLESWEYEQAREQTELAAQTPYTLEVYEAGSDPALVEPLSISTLTLPSSGYVYVVLHGEAHDLQWLYHTDNTPPTAPLETFITFISTAAQSPELYERTQPDLSLRLPYRAPLTRNFPTGDYGFQWASSPPNTGEYTIIESVQTYRYEAGMSYTVFITGRGTVGTSLILEREVGLDAAQLPTPAPQPRYTFVNASSQPLQVLIDGVAPFSPLAPSAVSNPVTQTIGRHAVVINHAETLATLYENPDFIMDMTNTGVLILTDSLDQTVNVLNFPHSLLPTDSIGEPVRLINLSGRTNPALALAYMPAVPPEQRALSVIETRFAVDGTRLRLSIPTEATVLNTASVGSGAATRDSAIVSGRYDFYAYDANSGIFEGALYDVEVQRGATHHIIAVPATEGALPLQLLWVTVPRHHE